MLGILFYITNILAGRGSVKTGALTGRTRLDRFREENAKTPKRQGFIVFAGRDALAELGG